MCQELGWRHDPRLKARRPNEIPNGVLRLFPPTCTDTGWGPATFNVPGALNALVACFDPGSLYALRDRPHRAKGVNVLYWDFSARFLVRTPTNWDPTDSGNYIDSSPFWWTYVKTTY